MIDTALRIGFSSVACHEWTLERITSAAGEWDVDGVELRSFGSGGGPFVCEPALTDGRKVRRLFADAGVDAACVASGVCLDERIFPPVLGHLRNTEHDLVEKAKEYIDIAEACGAEHARLYGFETQGRERRKTAMRRICERLAKVCDHARHREVIVLIENGGSFPLAEDLVEILERVASPHIGAAYDIATAQESGDDPAVGVRLLGRRCAMLRVRDLEAGEPVTLGTGEVSCESAVRSLRTASPNAWVMYTWDRAWVPGLAAADRVIPGAIDTLFDWAAEKARATAAA